MAFEVNTFTGLRAEIMEVSIGAWTAMVEVDTEEELSGPALIEVDGEQWIGTFRRGEVESGRFIGEVIGGFGGLSTELEARFYSKVALGLVLADLLIEIGEVASPLTLSNVVLLTARVEAWSRSRGTAGGAIRQFVDETPATVWRILRDGTLFIGDDLFAPVSPDFEFIEIDRQPDQGKVIIAPEEGPTVKPGDGFEGQNVSAVVTHVEPEGTRQEIFFEDASANSKFDRLLGPMQRFIEQLVGRRIDYSQIYEAKVVKQSPGLVDLLPDDLRIRGIGGLINVPIFHGLPGISLVVLPGERVLIAFRNGDPKLPAVIAWIDGGGGPGTTVTLDATFKALTIAPLGVVLQSHSHMGVTTGAGVSGPPVPTN